jgi:hypothetical protein
MVNPGGFHAAASHRQLDSLWGVITWWLPVIAAVVLSASTVWRFAGRTMLLARPWRRLESWAMQLKAEGQKTQGSA